MKLQQEAALLAAFRAVDARTKHIILSFSEQQAEKQVPQRPQLRLVKTTETALTKQ